MDKFDLGWTPALDRYLETFSLESFVRITEKHKSAYRAVTTGGEQLNCYVPGKVLYATATAADLPAVGDWCLIGSCFVDDSNEQAATISQTLPRHSKISRMCAGPEAGEQVLAANIDFVFVITSLNRDFSVNRLHRYVLLARSGNAQPIIVLSKADLADDSVAEAIVDDLHSAFPDVPSTCVSNVTGQGIEHVRAILSQGQTAVFVGSSGVGKSTLVNALLKRDLQKTSESREADDKGRHTTSGSGLFFLPEGGGMIIDTPGLREVAIVGDSDELKAMMPTVSELSATCKFTNCTHKHEPGCAVLSALDEGSLSQAEYAGFSKLERELAFARRKLDERLESAQRKKWKRIAVENRRRRKT